MQYAGKRIIFQKFIVLATIRVNRGQSHQGTEIC